MKIGGLQKATLLGGEKGLNKIIEYVSYVETPKTGRWLKGQELMISAFYAMKQNIDQQLQVLEAMNSAGSSALVISYPEIWGNISPVLIQKADEYEIPLLSIPQEVSYADIITPVSRAIAKLRIEQLEFINNLHNTFANMVLANKDLKFFAEKLHQLTGFPVLLLSSEINAVVCSGCKGQVTFRLDYNQIVSNLKSNNMFICDAYVDSEKYNAYLFPVRINKQVEGAVGLLTQSEHIPQNAILAGEQAAIVYGWYILKDISIKDSINRKGRDFLDYLLNNPKLNEDKLKNRAVDINLSIDSPHCVVMIDKSSLYKKNTPSSSVEQKVLNWAKETFLNKYPKSVAVQQGHKTILLLSLAEQKSIKKSRADLIKTAKAFYEKIATNNEPIPIGIGRIYYSLNELKTSYKEAETALKLANKVSDMLESKIVHINEVEEFAFLYEVKEKAPLYLKKTLTELNELREYDSKNGTELFNTLKELFLAEQNINQAARKLFIHRNTIAYRKEKIKSILSCDPFTEKNKFRFELALKLYILNTLD
jgi:purine catabolism regulator